MKNLSSFVPETITVCFHVGRGGRFNNPGYKSFNPYMRSLVDIYTSSGCNSCLLINDDEEGNVLPDEEWKLIDGGGNTILEGREAIESPVGVLEWDTIYDTDIVRYIEDCTEEEYDILYKAYLDGESMDDNVADYVCEYKGMKRVNSVKCYPSNMEVSTQHGGYNLQRDTFDGMDEDEVREYLEEESYTPASIDLIIDKMESYEWID